MCYRCHGAGDIGPPAPLVTRGLLAFMLPPDIKDVKWPPIGEPLRPPGDAAVIGDATLDNAPEEALDGGGGGDVANFGALWYLALSGGNNCDEDCCVNGEATLSRCCDNVVPWDGSAVVVV